MCVKARIETNGVVFELNLEEQKSIIRRDAADISVKFVESIMRMTKAVKVETSNGYQVELLDLSRFDNQMGLCLRSLQKKFFGVSDEGKERFEFFRVSTNPKDKERYQRMLEGQWKAQLDEKNTNEGGKIIVVAVDNFIKMREFRAMYDADRVNFYVFVTKGDLRKVGYETEPVYEFETLDNVHKLKRIE